MLRLGIHIGAPHRAKPKRRLWHSKRRGQRHAINRFQSPEQKSRHGHYCNRCYPRSPNPSAFVSRTSRAATCTELSFFLAKRLRRVIRHGDHFARWHNLNRQVGRSVFGQLRPHHVRLPNQQNRTPYSRAASTLPSTSGRGALSPPMASTAMVIMEARPGSTGKIVWKGRSRIRQANCPPRQIRLR